ncbi:hypothetical protein L3Q82_018699, partial [Scortum barcoo]
ARVRRVVWSWWAAARLKCFLYGLWTGGTAAGPRPSGVESMCRRLRSHLPPPSLGTEAGSRQGKQADNQSLTQSTPPPPTPTLRLFRSSVPIQHLTPNDIRLQQWTE